MTDEETHEANNSSEKPTGTKAKLDKSVKKITDAEKKQQTAQEKATELRAKAEKEEQAAAQAKLEEQATDQEQIAQEAEAEKAKELQQAQEQLLAANAIKRGGESFHVVLEVEKKVLSGEITTREGIDEAFKSEPYAGAATQLESALFKFGDPALDIVILSAKRALETQEASLFQMVEKRTADAAETVKKLGELATVEVGEDRTVGDLVEKAVLCHGAGQETAKAVAEQIADTKISEQVTQKLEANSKTEETPPSPSQTEALEKLKELAEEQDMAEILETQIPSSDGEEVTVRDQIEQKIKEAEDGKVAPLYRAVQKVANDLEDKAKALAREAKEKLITVADQLTETVAPLAIPKISGASGKSDDGQEGPEPPSPDETPDDSTDAPPDDMENLSISPEELDAIIKGDVATNPHAAEAPHTSPWENLSISPEDLRKIINGEDGTEPPPAEPTPPPAEAATPPAAEPAAPTAEPAVSAEPTEEGSGEIDYENEPVDVLEKSWIEKQAYFKWIKKYKTVVTDEYEDYIPEIWQNQTAQLAIEKALASQEVNVTDEWIKSRETEVDQALTEISMQKKESEASRLKIQQENFLKSKASDLALKAHSMARDERIFPVTEERIKELREAIEKWKSLGIWKIENPKNIVDEYLTSGPVDLRDSNLSYQDFTDAKRMFGELWEEMHSEEQATDPAEKSLGDIGNDPEKRKLDKVRAYTEEILQILGEEFAEQEIAGIGYQQNTVGSFMLDGLIRTEGDLQRATGLAQNKIDKWNERYRSEPLNSSEKTLLREKVDIYIQKHPDSEVLKTETPDTVSFEDLLQEARDNRDTNEERTVDTDNIPETDGKFTPDSAQLLMRRLVENAVVQRKDIFSQDYMDVLETMKREIDSGTPVHKEQTRGSNNIFIFIEDPSGGSWGVLLYQDGALRVLGVAEDQWEFEEPVGEQEIDASPDDADPTAEPIPPAEPTEGERKLQKLTDLADTDIGNGETVGQIFEQSYEYALNTKEEDPFEFATKDTIILIALFGSKDIDEILEQFQKYVEPPEDDPENFSRAKAFHELLVQPDSTTSTEEDSAADPTAPTEEQPKPQETERGKKWAEEIKEKGGVVWTGTKTQAEYTALGEQSDPATTPIGRRGPLAKDKYLPQNKLIYRSNIANDPMRAETDGRTFGDKDVFYIEDLKDGKSKITVVFKSPPGRIAEGYQNRGGGNDLIMNLMLPTDKANELARNALEEPDVIPELVRSLEPKLELQLQNPTPDFVYLDADGLSDDDKQAIYVEASTSKEKLDKIAKTLAEKGFSRVYEENERPQTPESTVEAAIPHEKQPKPQETERGEKWAQVIETKGGSAWIVDTIEADEYKAIGGGKDLGYGVFYRKGPFAEQEKQSNETARHSRGKPNTEYKVYELNHYPEFFNKTRMNYETPIEDQNKLKQDVFYIEDGREGNSKITIAFRSSAERMAKSPGRGHGTTVLNLALSTDQAHELARQIYEDPSVVDEMLASMEPDLHLARANHPPNFIYVDGNKIDSSQLEKLSKNDHKAVDSFVLEASTKGLSRILDKEPESKPVAGPDPLAQALEQKKNGEQIELPVINGEKENIPVDGEIGNTDLLKTRLQQQVITEIADFDVEDAEAMAKQYQDIIDLIDEGAIVTKSTDNENDVTITIEHDGNTKRYVLFSMFDQDTQFFGQEGDDWQVTPLPEQAKTPETSKKNEKPEVDRIVDEITKKALKVESDESKEQLDTLDQLLWQEAKLRAKVGYLQSGSLRDRMGAEGLDDSKRVALLAQANRELDRLKDRANTISRNNAKYTDSDEDLRDVRRGFRKKAVEQYKAVARQNYNESDDWFALSPELVEAYEQVEISDTAREWAKTIDEQGGMAIHGKLSDQEETALKDTRNSGSFKTIMATGKLKDYIELKQSGSGLLSGSSRIGIGSREARNSADMMEGGESRDPFGADAHWIIQEDPASVIDNKKVIRIVLLDKHERYNSNETRGGLSSPILNIAFEDVAQTQRLLAELKKNPGLVHQLIRAQYHKKQPGFVHALEAGTKRTRRYRFVDAPRDVVQEIKAKNRPEDVKTALKLHSEEIYVESSTKQSDVIPPDSGEAGDGKPPEDPPPPPDNPNSPEGDDDKEKREKQKQAKAIVNSIKRQIDIEKGFDTLREGFLADDSETYQDTLATLKEQVQAEAELDKQSPAVREEEIAADKIEEIIETINNNAGKAEGDEGYLSPEQIATQYVNLLCYRDILEDKVKRRGVESPEKFVENEYHVTRLLIDQSDNQDLHIEHRILQAERKVAGPEDTPIDRELYSTLMAAEIKNQLNVEVSVDFNSEKEPLAEENYTNQEMQTLVETLKILENPGVELKTLFNRAILDPKTPEYRQFESLEIPPGIKQEIQDRVRTDSSLGQPIDLDTFKAKRQAISQRPDSYVQPQGSRPVLTPKASIEILAYQYGLEQNLVAELTKSYPDFQEQTDYRKITTDLATQYYTTHEELKKAKASTSPDDRLKEFEQIINKIQFLEASGKWNRAVEEQIYLQSSAPDQAQQSQRQDRKDEIKKDELAGLTVDQVDNQLLQFENQLRHLEVEWKSGGQVGPSPRLSEDDQIRYEALLEEFYENDQQPVRYLNQENLMKEKIELQIKQRRLKKKRQELSAQDKTRLEALTQKYELDRVADPDWDKVEEVWQTRPLEIAKINNNELAGRIKYIERTLKSKESKKDEKNQGLLPSALRKELSILQSERQQRQDAKMWNKKAITEWQKSDDGKGWLEDLEVATYAVTSGLADELHHAGQEEARTLREQQQQADRALTPKEQESLTQAKRRQYEIEQTKRDNLVQLDKAYAELLDLDGQMENTEDPVRLAQLEVDRNRLQREIEGFKLKIKNANKAYTDEEKRVLEQELLRTQSFKGTLFEGERFRENREEYRLEYLDRFYKVMAELEREDLPFGSQDPMSINRVKMMKSIDIDEIIKDIGLHLVGEARTTVQQAARIELEQLKTELDTIYENHRRLHNFAWLSKRAGSPTDMVRAYEEMHIHDAASMLTEKVLVRKPGTDPNKSNAENFQTIMPLEIMFDFQKMGQTYLSLEHCTRLLDSREGAEDGPNKKAIDTMKQVQKELKDAMRQKALGYEVVFKQNAFDPEQVLNWDENTSDKEILNLVNKLPQYSMDTQTIDGEEHEMGLVKETDNNLVIDVVEDPKTKTKKFDEETGRAAIIAGRLFSYHQQDIRAGFTLLDGGFFLQRVGNLDDYLRKVATQIFPGREHVLKGVSWYGGAEETRWVYDSQSLLIKDIDYTIMKNKSGIKTRVRQIGSGDNGTYVNDFLFDENQGQWENGHLVSHPAEQLDENLRAAGVDISQRSKVAVLDNAVKMEELRKVALSYIAHPTHEGLKAIAQNLGHFTSKDKETRVPQRVFAQVVYKYSKYKDLWYDGSPFPLSWGPFHGKLVVKKYEGKDGIIQRVPYRAHSQAQVAEGPRAEALDAQRQIDILNKLHEELGDEFFGDEELNIVMRRLMPVKVLQKLGSIANTLSGGRIDKGIFEANSDPQWLGKFIKLHLNEELGKKLTKSAVVGGWIGLWLLGMLFFKGLQEFGKMTSDQAFK